MAEILPLQDLFVGQIRKSLLIFMGAVAFVLLIACANVANLLLMKGSLRRQEMAVRTALGAPRSRLIRQLLTESAMLSIGGAIAGLLFAILGVRALLALAPDGIIPRVAEIHLDARVIGFALGLGAVTGILFGLLPAVQATGRELRTFLSQAGRAVTGHSERLRSVLVVSEIALTLVLLNLDQLMQVVPLKKSRIYYLTHTGQIPFTKVGRTLLFDYDRIMQWLEDRNVGSSDHGVSHSA